jgi:hypothetical protein
MVYDQGELTAVIIQSIIKVPVSKADEKKR